MYIDYCNLHATFFFFGLIKLFNNFDDRYPQKFVTFILIYVNTYLLTL